MEHRSLDIFLREGKEALARGPVAMVFAEDPVEVASTLRHHLDAGFREVLLFATPDIALPAELAARVRRVALDPLAENAVTATVNAVIAAAPPGTWLYYCYNAEYLFHPFCETRSVSEMLAFHAEERREAMLTYVIDLYAPDLGKNPDAVNLQEAMLDRSGYYALARTDAEGRPRDRQLDFFGGIRWRFEEHVPPARRRIDRIALFRARKGLELRPDHTFNVEECNTYACPWHHNLTATVCSFRTAKALRTNPGSRGEIRTFRWHNSEPFRWESQQLMDLGLMEPGQWF